MALVVIWHDRAGGAAALVDRRNVRRSQRRTLDPQHLQHAVTMRHERRTLRSMAGLLARRLSTVGNSLKSMGVGRLKDLQPPVAVRRYQWARAGEMIHVDIKHMAGFNRVGQRITGDRRQNHSPGADHEKALVEIDNARRLASAKLLHDEKQATTVCFLLRLCTSLAAWELPAGAIRRRYRLPLQTLAPGP